MKQTNVIIKMKTTTLHKKAGYFKSTVSVSMKPLPDGHNCDKSVTDMKTFLKLECMASIKNVWESLSPNIVKIQTEIPMPCAVWKVMPFYCLIYETNENVLQF
jgi:hypothetical protein